ncbi:hypothetical protein V2J09_002677 [Rumex salicifolius]
MSHEIVLVVCFLVLVLGGAYAFVIVEMCPYFHARSRSEREEEKEISYVVIDIDRTEEIAERCDECVICLGEFAADDDGVARRTLSTCGHRFHVLCIESWFRGKAGKHRRCPICRAFVPFDSPPPPTMVVGVNSV